MKKIFTFLLLAVTGAWIFVTGIHFHGLNNIQRLCSYSKGLLALNPPVNEPIRKLHTLACEAVVHIDSLGIPHIQGKDEYSSAYAAGFMHARDRYFQMEMITHTVRGRLSEVVGEDGLPSDIRWQPLCIDQKARQLMDSLTIQEPALAATLKAYADGVNDYIQQEDESQRDPMYLAWDCHPAIWKPYYALLIQWYMSFELSFMDDFYNRQELLDKIPESVRNRLYPALPDSLPVIIPGNGRSPAGLPGKLSHFLTRNQPNHYNEYPSNPSLGSNNWILGKTHTDSGQIFLCNDLHLFLVHPNIFYEMEIQSPARHTYGFTIPGIPIVVTGHNEHIAWGITNGGWDVTEQYVLKMDTTGRKYWLDGKWDSVHTTTFTIPVKNGKPAVITANYTVFGKIEKKDSVYIAYKWYPGIWNAAARALWRLSGATGWDTFKDALRYYDYPSQNFAYADIEGNIGMVCAGKMPLKPAAYAGGLLDGTVSASPRFIPFDSLPQVFNPAKDYLFSANQLPDNSGRYYSARWFDDLYRPRRIDQLLGRAVSGATEEDMRKMQLDEVDLSVPDIRHLLLRYTDTQHLPALWKAYLTWDGALSANDLQSSFFKTFLHAAWLTRQQVAAALGVRKPPTYDQFMHFLLAGDSLVIGRHTLSSRLLFINTMTRADSIWQNEKGSYAYAFSIPQMTFLPGFDISINSIGGDENTINVNYRQVHPVVRTIIELKSGHIHSKMINALGQTGRLNDSRYIQQLGDWESNRLHDTRFEFAYKPQSGCQTIQFSTQIP